MKEKMPDLKMECVDKLLIFAFIQDFSFSIIFYSNIIFYKYKYHHALYLFFIKVEKKY